MEEFQGRVWNLVRMGGGRSHFNFRMPAACSRGWHDRIKGVRSPAHYVICNFNICLVLGFSGKQNPQEEGYGYRYRNSEIDGDLFIINYWLTQLWRLRHLMICCLQAGNPERLVLSTGEQIGRCWFLKPGSANGRRRQMLSLRSEADRGKATYLHFFVLFRLLMDEMVTTYIGEGPSLDSAPNSEAKPLPEIYSQAHWEITFGQIYGILWPSWYRMQHRVPLAFPRSIQPPS